MTERRGMFSPAPMSPASMPWSPEGQCVRAGKGRTLSPSHTWGFRIYVVRLHLLIFPDHVCLFSCLPGLCYPRTGRRCFPRMTSSARWAGSGKMKSGPRTSIGPLTNKVGSTWSPVSTRQTREACWKGAQLSAGPLGLGFWPSLGYFIWGTSWVSPHCKLQIGSQWPLESL